MDIADTTFWAWAWALPLAPIVALVLWWRGCLSRAALDAGPAREVGLRPIDLLLAVGLFLLGQAVYGAAAGFLFTIDPAAGRIVGGTTTQGVAMLLGQAMSYGPVIAYLLIKTRSAPGGWRRLGLWPRRPVAELGLSVKALFAALPMMVGLLALGQLARQLVEGQADPLAHDTLRILTESDSTVGTLLLAAAAIAVAPVVEELTFRGLIQTALLPAFGMHRWALVLAVGAGFALVHTTAVGWHALPALMAFGVLLGWLYERTGSLWPSILVHAGFNAFNFLWVAVFYRPTP